MIALFGYRLISFEDHRYLFCSRDWKKIFNHIKVDNIILINNYLGIRAFASSEFSGHKFAIAATSYLWKLFNTSMLIRKIINIFI